MAVSADPWGDPGRDDVRRRARSRDDAAPLALPKIRIAVAWHERDHEDPPHRWLRTSRMDPLPAGARRYSARRRYAKSP
jgi:hypothetical protein